MRRKRFIQLWVRSTTQRRALKPASFLMARASSPRLRMWAVKPNSSRVRRPPHSHSPCPGTDPGDALEWAPGAGPETVQCSPHQFHVVAVGSVHRQPHRDDPGVGQQTAFDPALARALLTAPDSARVMRAKRADVVANDYEGFNLQ